MNMSPREASDPVDQQPSVHFDSWVIIPADSWDCSQGRTSVDVLAVMCVNPNAQPYRHNDERSRCRRYGCIDSGVQRGDC